MSIQVANVTTDGTTVYTSSGNTAITFLSICNYSASNVAANVHVVPNGGTATVDNIVLVGLELTASGNATGDTYQFYAGSEKLLLSNGDFVVVQSTANNAITTCTSYITV